MKLRPSEAFRRGLADVGVLKAQIALPETADELCEVAKSLKASPEDIFLGERATETAFKSLDKAGRLANYRVIHFATHGLVSGDLHGVPEPALLLTPPDTATPEDDGLLTASGSIADEARCKLGGAFRMQHRRGRFAGRGSIIGSRESLLLRRLSRPPCDALGNR